jgi:hypothetical protein
VRPHGIRTLDDTDKNLYVLTQSGFTAVHFAFVPLSVADLKTNQGTASGGTIVTIRGSGFRSGCKAYFNDAPAATTFVDSQTLTVVTPQITSGGANSERVHVRALPSCGSTGGAFDSREAATDVSASKRSVEPASLSCSRPHSRRMAPMLPSDRCSRAANSTNSTRRAGLIRMVTHAFHSPISRTPYNFS